MASKRCGKNLLKAVLFTCLVSHLTRADYKENIFRRYTIGMKGCENSTKQRQNMDIASSTMMCQFDDNCLAFQYNQFTGEYQSCDRYKVSSLILDGRSYWVKRTASQCKTNTAGFADLTLKKPLQVGDLIYLSFTFVKQKDHAQITLSENSTGEYIFAMYMMMNQDNHNNTILYSQFNNIQDGEYVKIPTLPLIVGVTNSLFILSRVKNFIVLLNGQNFPDYSYSFPLDSVRYLETSGPIQIHEFCV